MYKLDNYFYLIEYIQNRDNKYNIFDKNIYFVMI